MKITAWMKANRQLLLWMLADFLLLTVIAVVAWQWSSFPARNQATYQLWNAQAILEGHIPYIDLSFEYPPLTILCFLLPALLTKTVAAYYVVFIIELLIFDLLTVFLIMKTAPRLGISAAQALLIHALMIIAVGTNIVAAYDIIPAAMVLASLAFFISGKSNLAWAVAGIGFMTKLFPALVIPLFFIYQLRQKQYKQIVQGAAIFIAITLVISSYWLVKNPGAYMSGYLYHLDRSLHSESVYGSFLLMGKLFGLTDMTGGFSFGSWNLFSPLADRLAGISFIIMAGLLSAVYLLYARDMLKRPSYAAGGGALNMQSGALIVQYAAVAILIFMLSAKVLSMQYMIWLCPLVPLVKSRWQLAAVVSFLLAGLISQLIYPYFYTQFANFVPFTSVLMFVRNVLLIACAVFLLLPPLGKPGREPQGQLERAAS
jgi:uncharacterized membrane protein